MQQESLTLNPLHMVREPSTSLKAYLLFLLVASTLAIVRLTRIWRAGPPFRFSHQENSSAYLKLLRTSNSSLTRWITCTFLVWGILTSTSLYDICDHLLDEKVVGSAAITLVIADYAMTLSMALFVVLLLFSVRWHILARSDHLGKLARVP
jgi:hypothetical protein